MKFGGRTKRQDLTLCSRQSNAYFGSARCLRAEYEAITRKLLFEVSYSASFRTSQPLKGGEAKRFPWLDKLDETSHSVFEIRMKNNCFDCALQTLIYQNFLNPLLKRLQIKQNVELIDNRSSATFR